MRCRHCSEVIGVYEPMVLLTDDGARCTSRALEREIESHHECYHEACYKEAHGGVSPST